MTSQSPRIYTYKITFEEVPYYYYGVHREKKFNEEYWGSPISNKWCWELYTPKKQILETFSSREDAGEVERRLIKPVYNTDKWCLNANCGGVFSLDTCSKAGKIGGIATKNLGVGIHGLTEKEMSENGRKGGEITKELGVGIHGLTPEERSEIGKKIKELGLGFFGRTKEQMTEDGRRGGKKSSSQKWKCLETGYVSNPGSLSRYQNKRGIDTSKRVRIS